MITKILLKGLVLISFSFLALSQVIASEINRLPASKARQDMKPPIVDHFACSDYCPGPEEQYLVKVYQGVEDPEECKLLGGRPAKYVGWGTYHICIVDKEVGSTKIKKPKRENLEVVTGAKTPPPKPEINKVE